MGVAFLSADSISANDVSTTTLTIAAFTLTGSNLAITPVAFHGASTERSVTSVTRSSDTYALQAATKLGNAKTELWGSTNAPSLAAGTLAMTINSTNGTWNIGYMAYTGVQQTTRFGTPVVSALLGTAASVDVASTPGNLVMSAITLQAGANTVSVTGTNHTLRRNATSTGGAIIPAMLGTKPGEAVTSLGYSWTTSINAVLYGMEVKQAVAATVPDAPSITASGHAPESIRVLVTPGASDGGSPRTNRHFEFRPTLVGGAWTRESDGTGTTVSYLIRNLTPNTQYDTRVIDQNAIGESLPSTVAVATTPETADPEALALIDFANPWPVVTPPLFGGGTVTQADIQHVLRLPIIPEVAATVKDVDGFFMLFE